MLVERLRETGLADRCWHVPARQVDSLLKPYPPPPEALQQSALAPSQAFSGLDHNHNIRACHCLVFGMRLTSLCTASDGLHAHRQQMRSCKERTLQSM